jgi:hypothetical protein
MKFSGQVIQRSGLVKILEVSKTEKTFKWVTSERRSEERWELKAKYLREKYSIE